MKNGGFSGFLAAMIGAVSPLLVLVACCLPLSAEAGSARIVSHSETWSGKMLLEGDVQVPVGAKLTLQPGTELVFPANAGFAVEGLLVAKGTAAKPVILRAAAGPKAGSWQGVSIHSSGAATELQQLRIEGAAHALTITESEVRISDSTLQHCVKGIVTGIGARVMAERLTVRDMQEGGIEASVRSQMQIIGCRFEKIAGFGIQAGQQASVRIRDNHLADVRFGILVSGSFPPLEKNTIERGEIGIGVSQAGPNAVVRGNRITGAKVGIACRQFASPVIEQNIIEGCDEGINCFQGASPNIHRNRLTRNKRALACIQMCNPQVTRNDLLNNDVGAYLHLSSFAIFKENNFEGNRLHIELDNMSTDWEVRAGRKPVRNRQKQSEVLMSGGAQGQGAPSAPSAPGAVEVQSEGFVNARGNYWGTVTTQEMTLRKGNGNILSIQDGFDVPTRAYEGWPGEYKQDRVKYDDWKPKRIKETGPPA